MAQRLVVWGGLAAVASVAAFLLLDPIPAAFVAVFVLVACAVGIVGGDWERHPTYEQRELARARRRAEKRERRKDVRARDRARWEAHQARKARRPGS